MDRLAAEVLPAGQCAQGSVPGQVRGGPQNAARGAQTRLPRSTHHASESEGLRGVASSVVPLPMDGLFQTSIRRSATRATWFPKLSLRKNPLPRHGRFGLVPNAAGLWSSSNGSAPLRFDSGLRPFPPGYSNDSIFDITASARVPAISPHVCPRCQPWGGETPEIHVPTTSRNAHRQYILPIASFLHSFRNSKYIARGFHNGFLQVAVSKTLGDGRFFTPRVPCRRSVSDTALRLLGIHRIVRFCELSSIECSHTRRPKNSSGPPTVGESLPGSHTRVLRHRPGAAES